MELALNKKLVDIKTGNIVGLLYQDLEASFPRLVPFKLDIAKSLNLQDADIAEFMEIEYLEVVTHGNCYAVITNSLYELEDKDIPFEKINDNISIWGYVFNRYSLVEFINSIEEANYGEDKLC